MSKDTKVLLVLASSSERRKIILENAGYKFRILPVNFKEEERGKKESIIKYAKKTAFKKALEALDRVGKNETVIAADTIVVLNNKILGKPSDKKEAKKMLSGLSGRTHKVVTGIAVFNKRKRLTGAEETRVTFKKLSKNEIEDYVNSGEPMDKAGAYGIQGRAGIFVKKISGCYFNVVGLPIFLLNELINKI